MKIVDPNDPFYRPFWRRAAIVAVVAAWAAFELLHSREGLWAALAIAMLVYCAWTFLINWKGSST